MKKKKLSQKLKFQKEKISNLTASKVIGGVTGSATLIFGDCLTSWDYECEASKGKQDLENASMWTQC